MPEFHNFQRMRNRLSVRSSRRRAAVRHHIAPDHRSRLQQPETSFENDNEFKYALSAHHATAITAHHQYVHRIASCRRDQSAEDCSLREHYYRDMIFCSSRGSGTVLSASPPASLTTPPRPPQSGTTHCYCRRVRRNRPFPQHHQVPRCSFRLGQSLHCCLRRRPQRCRG